jgi:hypothetical protein
MDNTEKKTVTCRAPHSTPKKADTKDCYHCNGRFGLVRYRRADKAFCSERCLNKFKTDIEPKMSLIKEWRNYFSRKR